MSWLSPSSEIVSGWLSSAYPGHGILGADIPTTGDSGGSPALNDGINPAYEYRWVVETPTASGVLEIFEDLTCLYSNPVDGTYSFVYRLFENGVSQGTATEVLQVGVATSVTAVSATTGVVTSSFSSFSVSESSINAVTGDSVGAFASYIGAVTSIGANTGSIAVSLGSFSESNSSINAVTGATVGSFLSSAGSVSSISATTGAAYGTIDSYSLSTTSVSAVTAGPIVLFTSSNGGLLWPLVSDVRAGVSYGPTGAEYVGAMIAGGVSFTVDDVADAVWAHALRSTTPTERLAIAQVVLNGVVF